MKSTPATREPFLADSARKARSPVPQQRSRTRIGPVVPARASRIVSRFHFLWSPALMRSLIRSYFPARRENISRTFGALWSSYERNLFATPPF